MSQVISRLDELLAHVRDRRPDFAQITMAVRRRLKQIRYRPDLKGA
ncbi:hypothetical protein [Streptomyces sp. Ru72]|nr:hypothetical protein [Streptomyces sp. Ru72]